MEGIEKIKAQALEMNDNNVNSIIVYLETRKDMYENYNKEEKSSQQMYEYICNKAELQKKNNVAIIMDRVVYLWAITYFTKSNEELGLNNKKENVVNKKTTTEKKENTSPKESKKDEKENQMTMFQEEEK